MQPKKIKRICIKRGSGYVPAEYAYNEKLTITPESFSYELTPYLETEGKYPHQKWSYKTNSSLYKDWFMSVAEMTPEYLHCDEDLFVTDIGSVEIIVTYEDKKKESACFFCPRRFFEWYFKLIREMIPAGERIPEMLLMEEDLAI